MQVLPRSTLSILAGSALAVFCISVTSDSPPLFASAFSFSDILSKPAQRSRMEVTPIKDLLDSTSSTQLGLTTTTTTTSTEKDAIEIYNKAREFAFRDDFGDCDNEYDKHYHSLDDEKYEIEESKFWLRQIIQIESGCASGTLAGKDLCENQDQAADIVARLREKIEIHERRVASRSKASDSIVPTIATELSVGAILVVLALFWTTIDVGQRHDDIPAMENYMQFLSILKDKGYGF
jgi:hypothetical protein